MLPKLAGKRIIKVKAVLKMVDDGKESSVYKTELGYVPQSHINFTWNREKFRLQICGIV